MKVQILHSGSSGNCTIVDDWLVIDAGVPINKPLGAETVVVLTHHHTDHTKCLLDLVGFSIFCMPKTKEFLLRPFPYLPVGEIDGELRFDRNGSVYRLDTVDLVHDAPCVGYIVEKDERERIFYATDFREIVQRDRIVSMLRAGAFDALYIECNNTLCVADFNDVYFGDPAKDGFHRRKSFMNHCNVHYLIQLFRDAGFTPQNPCPTSTYLLHKSSYYYSWHPDSIDELCKIATIINPFN